MTLCEPIFKFHIFSAHGFFPNNKQSLSKCILRYLTTGFCRNTRESIALKINVMSCAMCFLIDSLAMLPTIILKPLQDFRCAKMCTLNSVLDELIKMGLVLM